MDRILQGSAATVYFTVAVDGTATDPTPDVAYVRSVRADGTELTPLLPAGEAGVGQFAFSFTPGMTALLDTITVYWTAAVQGIDQTFTSTVEIVGGVLFTTGELRQMSTGTGGLANTTNYPTEKLVGMRTRVEQALEDACGVAFVPRYARDTLSGPGTATVGLKWPRVRAVRDVTVDGVLGVPADYAYTAYGSVYYATGWTWGHGNIVIGYEHGHDRPPERIRQAALLLAKTWLTPSAADDRAINMSNDTGTYALFQAGVRGHLFSIPEVQAAVDQYKLVQQVA